MSVWYCSEHGLTGPMGCCGKATLARIAPTTPAPSVYFEHPATGSVQIPNILQGNSGVTSYDASMTAELSRLRSEVQRLREDLEAASQDTARLDWLEAHSWRADNDGDLTGPREMPKLYVGQDRSTPPITAHTVRAAIDAARATPQDTTDARTALSADNVSEEASHA